MLCVYCCLTLSAAQISFKFLSWVFITEGNNFTLNSKRRITRDATSPNLILKNVSQLFRSYINLLKQTWLCELTDLRNALDKETPLQLDIRDHARCVREVVQCNLQKI